MAARSNFFFVTLFVSILVATSWAYIPGLSGGFLFDDFVNLPALGNYGPVDNWSTFVRYITSGIADPTGRPFALLSFLIDADNWPAEPFSFKRTNLLIHLTNAGLLYLLLWQLGKKTKKTELQIKLAAVLGAGLWALHPLWVSTTLYVVQREAMLPTTFAALGLLAYLRGREKIETGCRFGVTWVVGSITVFTLLAVLSKANGVLLPVLVLVVELAFLRPAAHSRSAPQRLLYCLRATSYPMAALLIVYLVYVGISASISGLSIRPWTEWQRILTEPRVVFDYLGLLVFPHPYSRGLFNDSYLVSTSLFEPWTTLPALLGVATLTSFACFIRRRAPPLALAILFYLVGQLLESTTIPLELYFEHRNYLPTLFFFWPIALWLVSDGVLSQFKLVISLGLLLLLTLETHAAASLWGNPDVQALVWAAQNPESPRAQAYAAQKERAAGLYANAEARLRRALVTHPDEIQLAVNLLGVRCDSGSISTADMEMAKLALIHGSNRGPLTFEWISTAIGLAENKSCHGLTSDTVQKLIDAAAQNQQAIERPRFKQDLLDLEGQLALSTGDNLKAEENFLAALKIDPKPEVALKQAAILGSHGLPREGLAQLAYFHHLLPESLPPKIRDMASLHEWLLYHDGYWEKEFEHLRETLQSDLDSSTPVSIGVVEVMKLSV